MDILSSFFSWLHEHFLIGCVFALLLGCVMGEIIWHICKGWNK